MAKKLNTEDFIRKARLIHGDKYDYSKVDYVDAKTKVCIICPEHGEFWQTPNSHLCKHACPECTGNKKYDTNSFIIKAKTIHGNNFNYEKVKYICTDIHVDIVCNVCGHEFKVTPNNHLMGRGCPKCAIIKRYKPIEQTKLPNVDNIITTEKWIARAINIKGEQFDYSKVEYKDSSTPITIICPIHGEFTQLPHVHLRSKHCCPVCANLASSKQQLSNTDKWIEKAKKVHGDKYDYSKVNYIRNTIPVCVICPEHGEFFQSPAVHLRGMGCQKCGRIKLAKTKTKNTNWFIEKAKLIHGDKYDYSKTIYTKSSKKVIIVCPIHGEFLQIANGHLSGQGCTKCSIIETHNKQRGNTKEWIEKAKAVHGNKYDYSQSVYFDTKTKICIICPEHGEFKQLSSNHLQGQGCPKCGIKTIWEKRGKRTTEEFIELAKLVHGNDYSYVKSVYENNYTPLTIICNKPDCKHEFQTRPKDHLNGQGCPQCKQSKLERKIKLLLEKNNIDFIRWQRFSWMGIQSLDFYLPEHNIGIECQGIQHFSLVEIFGGQDEYEVTIKRDQLKYNLCKENGIRILYYTNVNKNIIPKTYMDTIYTNKEELLNEILKNKL